MSGNSVIFLVQIPPTLSTKNPMEWSDLNNSNSSSMFSEALNYHGHGPKGQLSHDTFAPSF